MAVPILASDASSLNPTTYTAPTTSVSAGSNITGGPTNVSTSGLSNSATNTPAVSSAIPTASGSTSSTTPTNATPGSGTSATTSTSQTDPRVRIAHLSGYTNPYPGILAPLANTNGMMFPYSPSIQQSHDVDYSAMAMVHSNQDYYAYSKTPNVSINIAAKFTVQNQSEGLYALACLHFLRSISKMNFGQNDSNKGLPPPVVMFSGYGEYMYNQVRCIVKGSSISIDDNVDKVKVTGTSGSAWLPALFTMNVSILVQQTANQMRSTFTLDSYRDGTLLAQGGWL